MLWPIIGTLFGLPDMGCAIKKTIFFFISVGEAEQQSSEKINAVSSSMEKLSEEGK